MKRYWIFLPVLALAGCLTPTRKYKEQLAASALLEVRAQEADAKAAGLQKDLDSAKKDFDAFKVTAAQTTEAGLKIQLDLNNQIKASNDQVANLQKSNSDIQQTLDAKKGELTKKVADLIKERDGLNAQASTLNSQLAAQTAAIADLQGKLAAAEADKKALEAAKQAEVDKLKMDNENLAAGLKAEIAAGQVTITNLKGKLTVNMVDKILFDSGQADVKIDGKKVLDKLGSVLNGVADKDIRIEGHTDNKPIVGDLKSRYATNWELSTARATAVARYLEDIAKVDGKRLIAAGYGEFRPVATNDTLEGRAQNRRIEIVLVPKE
jgi:chemotaxis protein MotB